MIILRQYCDVRLFSSAAKKTDLKAKKLMQQLLEAGNSPEEALRTVQSTLNLSEGNKTIQKMAGLHGVDLNPKPQEIPSTVSQPQPEPTPQQKPASGSRGSRGGGGSSSRKPKTPEGNFSRFTKWASENKKGLGIGTGAVILGGSGLAAYKHYKNKNKANVEA